MSSFKYAISGGTGWLGQELIYSLIEHQLISNLSEICVFSSRKVQLNFPGVGSIQTRPFIDNDFREVSEVDYFIHLAFLTRNLLLKFGFWKYVEINEKLTEQALRFIRIAKPTYVANVSSGAVFSRSSMNFEDSIQANPYGYLKLSEERRLSEYCSNNAINLSIGRLWGATGSRMPINRAYAISDFISQAILNRQIFIKSNSLVWRRYCYASNFMELLLLTAKNYPLTVFDSGGPRIEIGVLAESVAREVGSDVKVVRKLNSESAPDDYYPRSSSFEDLASEFSVNLVDMPGQVRATVMGHQVHFKTLN